jgi:hypothetical protein
MGDATLARAKAWFNQTKKEQKQVLEGTILVIKE